MYENPGGSHGPPAPAVDAHANKSYRTLVVLLDPFRGIGSRTLRCLIVVAQSLLL